MPMLQDMYQVESIIRNSAIILYYVSCVHDQMHFDLFFLHGKYQINTSIMF